MPEPRIWACNSMALGSAASGRGRGSIPRLCGVPSEREECCRVESQGLHPGLVCDAPLGHGIAKHGGRAWYRNRGQGMDAGFETWWWFGTEHTVREWYRKRGGSETRDVCERS